MYTAFFEKGIGSNYRERDPADPKNWAAKDLTKDLKAKFIDTNDYKLYSLEMENVKRIMTIKTKRTHDSLYLEENRYENTKEMFKFIFKMLFQKKIHKIKNEDILDIGCAAGEFIIS